MGGNATSKCSAISIPPMDKRENEQLRARNAELRWSLMSCLELRAKDKREREQSDSEKNVIVTNIVALAFLFCCAFAVWNSSFKQQLSDELKNCELDKQVEVNLKQEVGIEAVVASTKLEHCIDEKTDLQMHATAASKKDEQQNEMIEKLRATNAKLKQRLLRAEDKHERELERSHYKKDMKIVAIVVLALLICCAFAVWNSSFKQQDEQQNEKIKELQQRLDEQQKEKIKELKQRLSEEDSEKKQLHSKVEDLMKKDEQQKEKIKELQQRLSEEDSEKKQLHSKVEDLMKKEEF